MDASNPELHYVRIRGRVYGPYDNARLKQMVSRGQLSRLHDISVDGQSWLSASTLHELFDSSPVSVSPLVYSVDSRRPRVATNEDADGDDELKLAADSEGDSAAGKASAVWFVGGVDMTVGPVDVPRISTLLRRGELNANSLVWRKGLADWVRLQDARELSDLVLPEKSGKRRKALALPSQDKRESLQDDRAISGLGVGDDLAGELIFQACQPLPWITCLAAVLSAMTILLIVGGLIVLGLGMLAVNWPRIMIGTACLALAVTNQFAVYYLLLYRQRLQKCQTRASLLTLVFAHQALGRLWLFAGVAIIVLTQISLAIFVWWIIDRQGLIQFLTAS